jgi:prepilin-type N-terminal cleavage/methylation domain-containing protein
MKNRDKGFSLLEVLITTAILGFVMAALYASLHSGSAEYETNNRRAWVVHQARMVLDQMSEELRQATRSFMIPAMPPANAPGESAATDNISFYMALPQGSPIPAGRTEPETPYYITYMWMPSGVPDTTQLGNAQYKPGASLPVPLPGGSSTAISGATFVNSCGKTNPTGHDNGMLVRIDPNTSLQNPCKVVCNYLQGEPDTTAKGGLTWTPTGFQVRESVVQVNNENFLQIHIILALQFTDSTNRLQTETVETKVFVRNLQ